MFGHKCVLRIGSTDSLGSIASLLTVGYEVIDFRQAFEQGVDDKGEPQTNVKGGTFNCVIPQVPSQEIIDWSLDYKSYQKGCFFLFDEEGLIIEKIIFSDAACTGMLIDYVDRGSKYISTRFVIHARVINYLNGVNFENKWAGFD